MDNSESETTERAVRDSIRRTLTVQSAAIEKLENSDSVSDISRIAQHIDEVDGRVVFTGVGKSGDVAKKISSTFNSIGVPSNFIHPVEALHGDLGTVSEEDVVVLISNSGNTNEMVELLQFLRSLDPVTVAITSDPNSKLGQRANYHINTKVDEEGAVVDLVPMASTTVTMVIGDCIANALMTKQDFNKQEFSHFHPGGTIGKRLLLEVEDILYTDIPKTRPTDTLAEVALKVSEGGKGIAVIQDDNGKILGILTDGDIRRLIESGTDFHDVSAREVMITDPVTTSRDVSALHALEILDEHSITQLVVTNDHGEFVGVVHIHDIMQEGLTT